MPTNPLAHGVPVDLDTLARTRTGLHQLAEQVLAADLYRHTGRIGLRPGREGVTTPPAIVDGTTRIVRTELTDLVLIVGEERTAEPITTVAAAGRLLDLVPGAPPVYAAVTAVEPERELGLDPLATGAIADWFAFGEVALERFLAAHSADVPGPPQLWPEHFDLAVTAPDEIRGEIVLGVSPGDTVDPEPYAYVSWQGFGTDDDGRPSDDWWNRPWGRWAPSSSFENADDLVELFEDGWRRVR